jgi:putative ABC transport system substrate-binding protein
VYFFSVELGSKRIGLLRELVPQAAAIAVLVNLAGPNGDVQLRDMQAGARPIGLQIRVLNASSIHEIDRAFETLARERPDALLVANDAFFNGRRHQIMTLATHHAIPAIYPLREFAAAGGLMSYGTSNTDEYRQAGIYAGRILKGAKPADLPVVQPTKFELVINLKTAKALGLDIPDKLLALADEVIE